MTPQHPLGPIAPAGGFFDSAAAITSGPAQAPIGPAADLFPQDLNFTERQMLANMQSTGSLSGAFAGAQAVGGPVGEGSGLRSQLPGVDQLQKDAEGFSERLEQFHELRAQFDAEQAAAVGASEAQDDAARHEDQTAVQVRAEPAQEANVSALQPAEPKTAAQVQA